MSVLLVIILIVSGLLRGTYLSHTPPELFGDEIDVGYQAFSLLKTGADIYNQPLPIYIHSLSEWRAPILIYATVPTIAALGNTSLAVRLPEIIFGSLAPLLAAVLAMQLTKSKKISLLSAFSMAILPWHIHYSRAAFEVVIMLDLIMAATSLLLTKRYVMAAVLAVLAMYTYNTALVFVPLFFGSVWLVNKSVRSIFFLIPCIIFVLPLGLTVISGSAASRFSLISIWNDNDQVKTINELRAEDQKIPAEIWHNKLQSISFRFVTNYLQAFSTDFLFIRGDSTQRHGIGKMGVLLPTMAPFVCLGSWWLIKKKKWIWLNWLLLAPIPAALTVDGGYHATRLFLMVPPIVLALGCGIAESLRITKSYKLVIVPLVVLLLSSGYQFGWYWHYYIVHYPSITWRWWHVGYEDAFAKLKKYENDYSRVFINNTYEPALIRYLFYQVYDPKKFHSNFTIDKPEHNITPGYDGFSFDNKVFFGAFNDTKTEIGKRLIPGSLYLLSQRDDVGGDWDWRKSPPSDIKVLDTIVNPYNEPIFYWVTKQSLH